MKAKNILHLLVIGLALFIVGCTGKDGDPGPGYAEAVKYGNIKVKISGKRPTDNIDFTNETDFKFYPTSGSPADASSVTVYDTKEKYIVVKRYFSGVDFNTNDNSFNFRLNLSATGEISNYYFYTENSILDGNTYFGISQSMYSDETNDVSDITNFSYDPATGRLKFDFTWKVLAANSSTGNDLTTTGTVNVIVMEGLNGPPK